MPYRQPRSMRPKKGPAEKKEAPLKVRLTDEQRKLLQAAADLAGLDVSSWIRMVALEEARRKTSGG